MKKKVIIIGAGTAGLTIANNLQDHFDVSVIEKSRYKKYPFIFKIPLLIGIIFRSNKMDYITEINKYEQICTVKKFKFIVKAKNKYNKIKDPSLKELYHFAFNKDIEHAHNSKYDVINLHKAVKYYFDNDIIKELK